MENLAYMPKEKNKEQNGQASVKCDCGKNKALQQALSYGIAVMMGVLMYYIGSHFAFLQRGYFAVGGEWLLSIIPCFFLYIIQSSEKGRNDKEQDGV